MPVPARTVNAKNIWVAAGDGDLDRVQVCLLDCEFASGIKMY